MGAPHERQVALDVGKPDIGFQAGFGFYLGLVATGIAAIVGMLAGADTATLLGLLPSTVTFVAIIGHIFARRARGLPERIGGSRWRRLACYVPPVAFAAMLLVPALVTIEEGTRFVVVTLVVVALTGVAAFGVDRMSRNRYIDAITADEPAATWTWYRTGFGYGGPLYTAAIAFTIVGGLAMVVGWQAPHGLFMVIYGALLLASRFDLGGDWSDFDPEDRWNPPEIRAHEAGLLVDVPYSKKLVRWENVEDVRLTEDELVIERRWLDMRCDRAGIDDPEAVLEGIERVRRA